MADVRSPRPWWLEREVAALIVLVIIGFFVRLTDLSVRGEESRRATIAMEMVWTGDWIVPRQQGELFLTRPPLQNWLIGWVGLARGGIDSVAIRLPSVIAILLTTLLVYGYARLFLDRIGALAAGAAFATMLQVLELGRFGETDALFTLMVSGSLLSWHGGWVRRRPAWRMWMAGYALAALGALIKGPQAPVYFAGPVFAYVLLKGRWRELFSWSHMAGLAIFAAIMAVWQVPFLFALGWQGTVDLWTFEVGNLARHATTAMYVRQILTYPLEIAFGCVLPWSLLLLAFVVPRFRGSLGDARDHVTFLVLCVLVTLPTVWFGRGAQSRYFMSLYPCIAVLVGLVVDRSFKNPVEQPHWRRCALAAASAIAIAGLGAIAGIRLDPETSDLAQSPLGGSLFALASLGAATLILWSRRGVTLRHGWAGVLGLAGWLAVTYSTLVTNSIQAHSRDAEALMAALKDRLPDDVRLVSIGPVHHLFTYHYGKPIEIIRPRTANDVPADLTYFCFEHQPDMKPLPFQWEPVAAFPYDRSRRATGGPQVIVARRVETSR